MVQKDKERERSNVSEDLFTGRYGNSSTKVTIVGGLR